MRGSEGLSGFIHSSRAFSSSPFLRILGHFCLAFRMTDPTGLEGWLSGYRVSVQAWEPGFKSSAPTLKVKQDSTSVTPALRLHRDQEGLTQ